MCYTDINMQWNPPPLITQNWLTHTFHRHKQIQRQAIFCLILGRLGNGQGIKTCRIQCLFSAIILLSSYLRAYFSHFWHSSHWVPFIIITRWWHKPNQSVSERCIPHTIESLNIAESRISYKFSHYTTVLSKLSVHYALPKTSYFHIGTRHKHYVSSQ